MRRKGIADGRAFVCGCGLKIDVPALVDGSSWPVHEVRCMSCGKLYRFRWPLYPSTWGKESGAHG